MPDPVTTESAPPTSSPSPAAPAPSSGPSAKRAPGAGRLVAGAVGLVAVGLLVLAGVPAVGSTPMPRVATLAPRSVLDLSRSGELATSFADLGQAVDADGRHLDYPSADELAARLDALPGWETAALFALDATPAELFQAGVSDPDVCAALNPAPTRESLPTLRHWKLALMDSQQRILGTTLLEVPAPGVEPVAAGAGPAAGPGAGPVPESRFPDWPRALVFRRTGGGAQLDG